MASTIHHHSPGTLQKAFLVARRFLLGAPKLRFVGVCGSDNSYCLDAIDAPSNVPCWRRRRRMMDHPTSALTSSTSSLSTSSFVGSSSSLLVQVQQHQHQQQLHNHASLLPLQAAAAAAAEPQQPHTYDDDSYSASTTGTSSGMSNNKHVEPYYLETVNYDPDRHPVPIWADSPNWRPNV